VTLTEQRDARVREGGQPAGTADNRHPFVEWVVIVVLAVVAALLIKTFAVQAFYIPSASMEPTLMPHDRVLVNKLSYDFGSPGIGNIIVFRRPPGDTDLSIDDLIKRVVAVGGDTLWVHNCGVYVNGQELRQGYLPRGWQSPSSDYCTTWPSTSPLPNPYKVPKGDVFVMGDNRYDSYDSRYWGPLPDSYIVGRAFVRMWPPSRIGFL
jgi:signal peptidase I